MRRTSLISLAILFAATFLSLACVRQADSGRPVEVREATGIINGKEVDNHPLKDLPVFLFILHRGVENPLICTGVMIGPDVALTIASCVDKMAGEKLHTERRRNELPPVIGVSPYYLGGEGVIKVVLHENYRNKRDDYSNDIAMLFLERPLRWEWEDETQFPQFSLDRIGILKPGLEVTVFGAGANEFVRGDDGVLQPANLSLTIAYKRFKIVSEEQSRLAQNSRYGDWKYFVTSANSKGSVCRGDAGGPVFARVNGTDVLVGLVVDYDSRCEKEGALISIYPHLDWIMKTYRAWKEGRL